jgi:hypothetical protein
MDVILRWHTCLGQNYYLGKIKRSYILRTSDHRPVVTHACCTWATTAGDENKFSIFERKVLRKIYGLVITLITKCGREGQTNKYNNYMEREI